MSGQTNRNTTVRGAKAIAVLGVVRAADEPLHYTDVAARVGLAPSRTSAILSGLRKRGLVRAFGGGAWGIDPDTDPAWVALMAMPVIDRRLPERKRAWAHAIAGVKAGQHGKPRLTVTGKGSVCELCDRVIADGPPHGPHCQCERCHTQCFGPTTAGCWIVVERKKRRSRVAK